MALTNPNKLINLQELSYFEGKLQGKYQAKAISLEGIEATTVEGALTELKNAIAGSDVTFQKLTTPNTGKLATYRFTKGTGAGATTMDVDIEKDHIRAIVGFVTITESGGKYYDGATEVTAADGVTGAGIYLKSQELDASGASMGVVKYADASAVVEYLTSGSQSGDMIVLTIDANHQITAAITDGTITKAKLVQSVQDSLNAADSAYQLPSGGIPKSDLSSGVQASLDLADTALQSHQDISGKADKVSGATNGNFAGLDANGNLVDSGKKAADFQAAGNYKTTQTAVSDPSKGNTPALEFIATISQNTNGEITATKQGIQVAGDSDIDEIFN